MLPSASSSLCVSWPATSVASSWRLHLATSPLNEPVRLIAPTSAETVEASLRLSNIFWQHCTDADLFGSWVTSGGSVKDKNIRGYILKRGKRRIEATVTLKVSFWTIYRVQVVRGHHSPCHLTLNGVRGIGVLSGNQSCGNEVERNRTRNGKWTG